MSSDENLRYTHYMRHCLIWLCGLLWTLPLSGQIMDGIQTESTRTVEDLIKDVFIKGNCKNVSNITAIGDTEISIGEFSNSESIFGFDSGIILSTGDILLADGPNLSIDESHSFNRESIDEDLSILATDDLFDVTGIEFDFVPLDSRVTFQYVFASEEYCEFVGTSFNDVFGFFVSGPGINGTFDNEAINVALLPGTNTNVSINNVNHLDNTEFYVSNETSTDVQNCNKEFVDSFQDLIEYDGFTISLLADIEVIPCETYHIRLVLGDVGDAMLDSAVFLESQSFDLGEKVNVRTEVPGQDEPIAYENCLDAQIVFTRSEFNRLGEACTIEYSLTPESEAINGVDFEEIPLSVTIPAGDTSTVVPIILIDDGIAEGPERLQLQFEYACDCLAPSSSELLILDMEDWSVTIDDISACADQSFTLVPDIVDGVPPFDYQWDTGAQSDTLQASLDESVTYSLTVTDLCGTSRAAEVDVDIQSQPSARLTGTFDLCETMDAGIPLVLEGQPPWQLSYSLDGEPQPPINDIQSSPYFLQTTTPGRYQLTAFSDAHCEGLVTGEAEVGFITFQIETEVTAASCKYSYDGSIAVTQLDAIPPFSLEWDTDTGDDNSLTELKSGSYTLSITDANGCLYAHEVVVPAISDDVEECLPIYLPNVFSPDNDGVNDIFSIYVDDRTSIERILALQVYDRWGGLVYEQRDFIPDNGETGWRGDSGGSALSGGVYAYKVTVMLTDGQVLVLAGDITLLK